MSLERVLKTLEGFGFAKIDAEVYICIAKKGPQKVTDIADVLKIPKQHLYPILKKLQNKGVVIVSPEQPTLFSAIAFEKALDLLVKTNIEQARAIKQTKAELLTNLRDTTKEDKT